MFHAIIIESARVAQDDSIRFKDVPEAKGYGQLPTTLIGLKEFVRDILACPDKVFTLPNC